ncbi:MerR family DNA-binding protein [Pseudomonas entomophila]|uniref:MerR family transcriptional regulator n=1 Tax=Pseudomonas entomophila TaxID=312306 RepID=UPI0023D8B56A|nr:MerR family transcriptional regulator [Pseudomonas entomophila]MDF0732379.1 MerR family DNA-binding protein [Pseudomonas entomophila]
MRIGELARRSGLSASRIRFYESSGLLTVVGRTANGYREYPAEALWILEIIVGAQAAGFSLEEVRSLLPVTADAWAHGELLDGLKRKVAEIEALQQRLAHSRAQLLVAIETIENRPEGTDCVDNAKALLGRLRGEGAA